MAPLNIFFGGDSKISKDPMGKCFQNLLMQALSKSDDRALIICDSISLLVKNINEISQKKFLKLRKKI